MRSRFSDHERCRSRRDSGAPGRRTAAVMPRAAHFSRKKVNFLLTKRWKRGMLTKLVPLWRDGRAVDGAGLENQ